MMAFLQNKSQSLLELAIFGAILLMVLGVLINYGMRYNYQQKAMQEAFRQALDFSRQSYLSPQNNPTAVSYLSVKDRHIADPQNPWAMGDVTPITASANVTRDFRMDQAADKPEELPRLIMDISGSRYAYTTAGFQIVPMVPYKLEKGKGEYDPIDRYREIYGNSIQACKELGSDGKCLEWTGDLKKAKFGPCTRTEAGPGGEGSCVERPLKLVRFIDSAGGGQIINYEAAVRQCRQIVDRYVCKQECERGKPKGSEENCGKICREKIETPWYCQTQEEHPTVDHRYTFFRLNKLFGISQPSQENKQKKEMGLQPDYTQLTNVEKNTLHKQETNAGVATDEQKDWQVTTQRTLRHLDRSTADSGAAGVATEPVDTVYREKAGQSQATAWKGAP